MTAPALGTLGGRDALEDGLKIVLLAAPVLFLASWAGGRLQSLLASTHLRAQTMLSFVGGLMLGMGLLHLLPHAVIELGSLDHAVWATLAGVLAIFLLMRFLHVHSHEPGVACLESEADDAHSHGDDETKAPAAVRWWTLLAGLSLHGIVDGMAIAAAAKIESGHSMIPGLAVLVVVLLHKPIDAMALTSTMATGGATPERRSLLNIGYAVVTPIAAVVAYLGLTLSGEAAGYVLAFAAGAFLCVALADLMPEVQFHSHHRVRLTAALIAGVSVSILLGIAEGANHGHAHAHDGDGHAGHRHPH